MKCDELKPIKQGSVELGEYWVYDADEVDAAIAELKAKVDELSFDKKLLENHWESEKIRCEAASRDCISLSNENAKLASKIESLKVGHRQGIANLKSYYKAKLEDVQATAYAESVDAGMENRKLKRALWLARAERAVAEQTVDEWSRYKEKHPFGSWRADPFEYWVQAWIYVEKLCRKKAKEYKCAS